MACGCFSSFCGWDSGPCPSPVDTRPFLVFPRPLRWVQYGLDLDPLVGPTTGASSPPARPPWRPCAAEATAIRCRLPAAGRRQPAQRRDGQGGPGRAQRGDTHIQRGRPDPAHRHFGSATTRARTSDATRYDTHPTPIRDLDTSTTPPAPEVPPLTALVREGSHGRMSRFAADVRTWAEGGGLGATVCRWAP